jgi:hypothetical protein
VPARLILGRLAAPAGDETMKLVGLVQVPATPALDPSAHGLRLLVADAVGGAVFDQTIAGGAGWSANSAHTAWRYVAPAGTSGVVKARVRSKKGTPGLLKLLVQARKLTLPTLANMPATAMVVFDLPVATTGQCGQTAAGSCVPNASGSTMRCRY